MSEERLATSQHYVRLDAVNPADGTIWQLYLSNRRIDYTSKEGMPATKTLGFIVPQVLMKPTAVFGGLRTEGVDGGFCYVGIPDRSFPFSRDGNPADPYRGKVFCVLVDDEKKILRWSWRPCDDVDKGLPANYGTGFKKRLL